MTTAPAWLPDWADAGAYPAPDELRPHEWAWQFMRRNPDYQRAWEALAASYPAVWLDVELDSDSDVEIDRDAALELRRVSHRFGVDWVANPARSSPSPHWLGRGQKFLDAPLGELFPNLVVKPGEVYIQFDLQAPIEPQLENARSIFKMLRPEDIKDVRVRLDKYPLYLRLLDAEASEVPREKMAKILFGKSFFPFVDIRNSLKQAHTMRDDGYRKLATAG